MSDAMRRAASPFPKGVASAPREPREARMHLVTCSTLDGGHRRFQPRLNSSGHFVSPPSGSPDTWKEKSFLLHTARVSNHQGGIPLESEHIQIGLWSRNGDLLFD